MDASLIEKRELITNRHDAALDKWPDRNTPEFIREIEYVINGLKEIIASEPENSEDRLELSRTYMYLGMALFDLAMSHKNDETLKEKYFTESAIAYENSEKLLLGIGDPLMAAKLNFNYANTLRGLSEGEDVGLLNAAKERYKLALDMFRTTAPQYVDQVAQTMSTIDNQINLARFRNNLASRVSKLEALQEKIRKAEAEKKPMTGDQISTELDDIRKDGLTPENIIQNINKEINGFMKKFDQPVDEEKASVLQNQMEEINKIVNKNIAPSGDSDDDNMQLIFKMLLEQFENNIKQGKVTRYRQESLKSVLNELKEMIDNQPVELDEMSDWISQLRSLISVVINMMQSPSTGKPEPPEGSRAAGVLVNLANTKINLLLTVNQPNLHKEERDTGYELSIKCSKAELLLYDAGNNDNEALAAEQEIIRPLTLEVRNYMRRRYLMVVNPYWELSNIEEKPGSVMFAGNNNMTEIIDKLCQKKKLKLIPPPSGENYALERWQQIQYCDIAVFSLSAKNKIELAETCYELGIARTLGKSLIVLADKSKPVPFDIDVVPVFHEDIIKDNKILSEAIDRAMLSATLQSKESTVAETIKYINTKYRSLGNNFEIKTALKLVQDAGEDPILIRSRIERLFTYLPGDIPMLIFPAWQPVYSVYDEPRCFHVMPYKELWSDDVTNIVRNTCESHDVDYIRGDEVEDPNIIHSIWTEICKATHVVVDITNLNPNVALELGIAHTLGKNIQVVSQPDTINNLFPMISKTRISKYESKNQEKELSNVISIFLEKQNTN